MTCACTTLITHTPLPHSQLGCRAHPWPSSNANKQLQTNQSSSKHPAQPQVQQQQQQQQRHAKSRRLPQAGHKLDPLAKEAQQGDCCCKSNLHTKPKPAVTAGNTPADTNIKRQCQCPKQTPSPKLAMAAAWAALQSQLSLMLRPYVLSNRCQGLHHQSSTCYL
jgi:hypothetical protein